MKRSLFLLFVIAFISLTAALFAAAGAESSGEVVLKWPSIWVAEDSKAATIAALVEQFNADNAGKIKIEVEPNPDYDGYRDKINTSIAAGEVPDLFVFNPDDLGTSESQQTLERLERKNLKLLWDGYTQWDASVGGSRGAPRAP